MRSLIAAVGAGAATRSLFGPGGAVVGGIVGAALAFGRVRADDCSEIDLHREDRRRKILLDQLLSGTSE